MKKIELLAPAGSIDSLKAAVGAGCDAAYIGGSSFGARAYAKNPDEELLLRAIDYMNLHGKQLYLTVNTLIKTEELEQKLYDFLYPYYRQGLSAVIVQDMGAIRLIHREFPELPIHASTQMNLVMAEGGELLADYGVSRMVLARELSLVEIQRIRAATRLEIEAFVHGALCYCYSGQCLMSSMLGGRSGNRGRCAQPCRLAYQPEEASGEQRKEIINKIKKKENSGEYLLSMKDMCTLGMIPELVEAGIDSFKIEGRMKQYEYVAGVTAAYRRQLELYYDLGPEGYRNYHKSHPKELPENLERLQELYNRGGFCGGYYKEHNGSQMMSMQRPNHSGVLVGTVVGVQKNTAEILLKKALLPGDVLEIRRNGKRLYDFTVKDPVVVQKYSARFTPGSGVTSGCEVFRMKNNSLLTELSKKYFETEEKLRVEAEFQAVIGEPLQLTVRLCDGTCTEAVVTGTYCEAAEKQPVTEERILTELKKTGDTPFILEEVRLTLADKIFFPMSSLKELRREAFAVLLENAAKTSARDDFKEAGFSGFDGIKRKRIESDQNGRNEGGGIFHALVTTFEQLKVVCASEQIREISLDITDFSDSKLSEAADEVRRCGKRLFFALPHIFRADTFDRYVFRQETLFSEKVSGYLIRNLEELFFLTRKFSDKCTGKELRLDYMLYVMNPEARELFYELGADRLTAPLELNFRELSRLDISEMELIIYGRIPLMVSAQCPVKNTSGCLKSVPPAKKGLPAAFFLRDRMGKKLPVVSHCQDCFSTIYNPEIFSICTPEFKTELQRLHPASLRLNFTLETGEETASILHALERNREAGEEWKEMHFTRGHIRRGIQ